MRDRLRDPERIQHILQAIDTINTHDIQYWEDAINNDPIAYYGLAKLIEIIGEAVFRLTKEFRQEHPEIPWDDIEGMRHIIVHEYFRISRKVLIGVIKEDISPLRVKLSQLLTKEQSDN